MTTKEVAEICGVTEKTVYNNAEKANVVLEHGKAKNWTEDELKRIQLVLMRNSANAGGQQTEGSVIKSTVESTFQSGLTIQELIRSGNVEAIKEFTQIAIEAAQQQNALVEAQKQNQLLLEENKQIKKDALVIAGWAEQRSVLAYSIVNNLKWSLSKRKLVGKQLSSIARQFHHKVGRVTDRDFGEVNAYGADTWALWESRFSR